MFGIRQSNTPIDSLLFNDAKMCVDNTRNFLRGPDAKDTLEKVAQISALVYIGAKVLSSLCDRDY